MGRKNIYLIGFRCAGKTTVGEKLAAALRRPFVDADEMLVTRAGRTVAEIVSAEGWPGFRRRETEVLKELAGQGGLVVATGGGVVTEAVNLPILKESGSTVYLSAGPEETARRMEADAATDAQRPSLTGKGVLEEVTAVLAERRPLYEGAANLTIDTEGGAPEELAEKILDSLSFDMA